MPEGDLGKGYNYLFGMPPWSLTFMKVQELEEKCGVAEEEQVNSVCLQDLELTAAPTMG